MDTSSSPLTIFCGKGGVGKTTLSLAFGLWHASHGKKVVVVTSHPLKELGVTVSLRGLKEAYPEAAANLFIIHIDPREVLANKFRQQIRSEFLANAVLNSNIYQSLIEVAPGLKEIAFLARLKQLAERRSQGEGTGNFDLLVWDAPATGHFIQTMKVAKDFDSYLSGPFSITGKEMLEFISDPHKISLIPVTTLEDMAVVETIELCNKLETDLKMQPLVLICNLASPLLSLPDSAVEEFYGKNLSGILDPADLKFVLDRHTIERELFKKLKASVNKRFVIIERRATWNSDLELLAGLSARVGENLMESGS